MKLHTASSILTTVNQILVVESEIEPMEQRILDITLQHAKDLNKVNLWMKMDVYAVVLILDGANNTKQRFKTPVDHDGDDNPTWEFSIKFAIDEAALQMSHLTLVFKLICRRALGDRYIGEVHVPIKELLDAQATGSAADGRVFVSYQVRKADGNPKGQISFSYKFSDKRARAAVREASHYTADLTVPVMAYPVGSSSGYPPPVAYPPYGEARETGGYLPAAAAAYRPPAGYVYGPPPAAGYGYPPPPPPDYPYPGLGGYGAYGNGYAPPPPVMQPAARRNNNSGLGLGTGLIAGALGGLLLGDIIADVGDFSDGGFGF